MPVAELDRSARRADKLRSADAPRTAVRSALRNPTNAWSSFDRRVAWLRGSKKRCLGLLVRHSARFAHRAWGRPDLGPPALPETKFGSRYDLIVQRALRARGLHLLHAIDLRCRFPPPRLATR